MHPLLRFLLGVIGLILLLPGACGVIMVVISLDPSMTHGHMPAGEIEFIALMLGLGALGVWLIFM